MLIGVHSHLRVRVPRVVAGCKDLEIRGGIQEQTFHIVKHGKIFDPVLLLNTSRVLS
jgi:hypothetical protein